MHHASVGPTVSCVNTLLVFTHREMGEYTHTVFKVAGVFLQCYTWSWRTQLVPSSLQLPHAVHVLPYPRRAQSLAIDQQPECDLEDMLLGRAVQSPKEDCSKNYLYYVTCFVGSKVKNKTCVNFLSLSIKNTNLPFALLVV